MKSLAFITCGNVDDGKSTLIGRLLLDSHSILDDQLTALEMASQKSHSGTPMNLALLTDGLKAERAQGITIDVAYRFFRTARRRFVMIDCPGHLQYTRNMVTGSSHAKLAILMIDASKGIVEQTSRHALICSLMGLRHVVVCINKMDLIDYSEERYQNLCTSFLHYAKSLRIPDLRFIPVSALLGDNVVSQSNKMPWHKGSDLLTVLESVDIESPESSAPFRFPVQGVIRHQIGSSTEERWCTGQIASGSISVGDEVTALSSGATTRIKALRLFDRELASANYPQSISILLEDEIDISRGDLLAPSSHRPISKQIFEAQICWLGEKPLAPSGRYLLQATTVLLKCQLLKLFGRFDLGTGKEEPSQTLRTNEVGRAELRVSQPLHFDPHCQIPSTGVAILIDEVTNQTVGAVLFA